MVIESVSDDYMMGSNLVNGIILRFDFESGKSPNRQESSKNRFDHASRTCNAHGFEYKTDSISAHSLTSSKREPEKSVKKQCHGKVRKKEFDVRRETMRLGQRSIVVVNMTYKTPYFSSMLSLQQPLTKMISSQIFHIIIKIQIIETGLLNHILP